MADTKITALTAITTVDPAVDVLPIVDVSDTTMAASGTTKKITSNQILGAGGTATLASATISGAASAAGLSVTGSTIPTNGVYLPSANNLGFAYNSTLGMTLNSTGLGVGVTPSGWNTVKPIQVGYGSIYGLSASELGIQHNAYYASGWKYIANGLAAQLQLDGTIFKFQAATNNTSGAGASLTWTTPMTLDASGNLFIGKTATGLSTAGIQSSPSGWIQATVSGDASLFTNRLGSDGKTVQLYRETLEVGNISVTTTGATFNSTSDYRLKESVSPLTGGLARVNALKPSVYKWKSNGSDGEGFLAHELAEVVPAAVSGEKDAVNEDGTIKAQSIDMSRIVPILVAAIKELSAEVNALKNA